MRNGLSQSTYDQIITYFLGQSSVYTDSMNLSEWHIYGSSRIGIYQTSINMAYPNIRIVNGVTTQETNTTVTLPSYTLFAVERGSKRYDLTNHLGNVLAVVSDKKIQVCTSTTISYYVADLVSATDYSPFGAPLAGRTYTAPNISYRFAFNGQEKDDEVSGEGNTMTAEFWQYDSRLGRRWNLDPVKKPWQSTFCTFSNNPIIFVDPKGNEDYYNEKGEFIATIGEDNGKMRLITQKTYDLLVKASNPTTNKNLFKKHKNVKPEVMIKNSYEIKIQSVDQQEKVMQYLEQLTVKSKKEAGGLIVLDVTDIKNPIVKIIVDEKGKGYADHYQEGPQRTDSENSNVKYVDNGKNNLVIWGTVHTHPQEDKGWSPEYGPSYPGNSSAGNKGSDVESAQQTGVNGYVLDKDRYVARHDGSREFLGTKGNADIVKDAIKTHKGAKTTTN